MSPKTAPHIDIVRLEDKETKLKSFIAAFLDEAANRSAAQPPIRSDGSAAALDDDGVLLLVIRSLDSPLAKAVTALMQERVIDMPIRAIFAMIQRSDLQAAGEGSPFSTQNSIRMAADARLLDVHEQIVLGPSASWIGDCMRRDPRKRDAYECYAANCTETARWARISFERLWSRSDAIGVIRCADLASAAACASLAGDPAATDRNSSTAG